MDQSQSVTTISANDPPTQMAVEANRINLDNGPQWNEFRPAIMAHFQPIIRQITVQAHTELLKNGCQRIISEKPKFKGDTAGSSGKHGDGDDIKIFREGMDRRLNRLKIYRKVFSSMVIYFQAYSPILFHIKKSYEDVLTFRLRQFKEAQHGKTKLFQERISVKTKMANYRFPDYNRLYKSRKYLSLLLTRIQKQDETIKFITEILSKMESILSDHYEKERDLEDQIKMLDLELIDRRRRSVFSTKRFEGSVDMDDANNVPSKSENDSDSEEEPIDQHEIIDEDKRMVLILAYAVCLKDIEESTRKLKIYETKYQGVFPRRELESTKRKILEEKSQIKFLSDEMQSFEEELIKLKEQESSVEKALEDLRQLPEDERLEATKRKFIEEHSFFNEMNDEDEEEEEDDEDDDYGFKLLEGF